MNKFQLNKPCCKAYVSRAKLVRDLTRLKKGRPNEDLSVIDSLILELKVENKNLLSRIVKEVKFKKHEFGIITGAMFEDNFFVLIVEHNSLTQLAKYYIGNN